LEKHWITQSGWFRLPISLFGIGVVDAWNGYRFHLGDNHRHKKMPLLDFVDILAFDCLQNTFPDEAESERAITIEVPVAAFPPDRTLSPMESARASLLSYSTLDETTVTSALTELTTMSTLQSPLLLRQ
jgi:hypothetical protein